MSLGERIAHFRKLHQWNQGQLAEKLGVRASNVSRWETDKVRPNLGTLGKIAEALGIGLEELTHQTSPSISQSEVGLINQLKRLDEEDQKLIKRMVDALLTRKRVQAALEAS